MFSLNHSENNETLQIVEICMLSCLKIFKWDDSRWGEGEDVGIGRLFFFINTRTSTRFKDAK